MENPIKMDDLGVPLFLETSILKGLGLIILTPMHLGDFTLNFTTRSTTISGGLNSIRPVTMSGDLA